MKNRKTELDVDFIGEQGRTLTPEEQQAISDFIKANKAKRALEAKRIKSRVAHQPKQTA